MGQASTSQRTPSAAIHVYLVAGLALMLLLLGGAGGWAAWATIAGAVVATGEVVIEGNSRAVQHREGGIVEAIHVRDGDRVAAGDVLITLDDTALSATATILATQLDELTLRRARLIAERDEAVELAVPDGLSADAADLIAAEHRLLAARNRFYEGQSDQLSERIAQTRDEIAGLTARRTAKDRELVLIGEELARLIQLRDQGLVEASRITNLERTQAQLEGERGQLTAEIARAEGRITETELQILQLGQDRLTQVLAELGETDSGLAERREQQADIAERLARMVMRAPQDGVVHELTIHTVGGVVSAEEVAMRVVPLQDRLVIEARVLPMDVDQVGIGQAATLRFAAFNQRTTPELQGSVIHVAADSSVDPATSESWYIARLAIPDEELARLDPGLTLLPGMPVDVFIQTNRRTVLSYLTKPLTDHMARAFVEE